MGDDYKSARCALILFQTEGKHSRGIPEMQSANYFRLKPDEQGIHAYQMETGNTGMGQYKTIQQRQIPVMEVGRILIRGGTTTLDPDICK